MGGCIETFGAGETGKDSVSYPPMSISDAGAARTGVEMGRGAVGGSEVELDVAAFVVESWMDTY
jgi:hypothetical protein